MKRAKWQNGFILIFVILGCLFTTISAYPGFMSPDSIDQYSQAKSANFSDWHPPLMAWIWSKLLWIYDGPQPMLLLNNLLYWISIGLISLRIRHFAISLLLLVLSLSPPIINFIGVIWKDTLLFSILFFQCSIIYYFNESKLRWVKKTLLISVLITLNFTAVMLRHNAASAVVPLIVLTLLLANQNIKLRYSILLGFILSGALFIAGLHINKILCKNKSLHPEQQLMVYDLMGISQAKNQNVLPNYLRKKLSLDMLKTVYSSCDGGAVAIFNMGCTTNNKVQLDSLKECWKKESIANPNIVAKHKWAAFLCLQTQSSLTTFPYIQANKYGFSLSNDNVLRDYYVKIIDAEFSKKFYKAWFYLLACAVFFLFSCFLFRYSKRNGVLLSIFISLSGLLYSLSYLALSPCNDLRYNYWTIGATLLSGIIFIDELSIKIKN